jgi:hypothetical protein
VRDVVHVTHQTRTIQGVPAIAVRDQLTIDGRLAELTFDWYAQDRQGNVWYLGEDSEEYGKKGKVSTKGSWEPGVGGAKPGIIMEAQPKVRDTYRQEYARREAEDMATVLSLTEHVTVPYGSFDNVLQTREFSCIERGAEHKYYAPGVGDVLEVSVRGGHERLELKEIKTEPD